MDPNLKVFHMKKVKVWMMRFDGRLKEPFVEQMAKSQSVNLDLICLNSFTISKLSQKSWLEKTKVLNTQKISRCDHPNFHDSESREPSEYLDKYFWYAFQALERDERRDGALTFSDRAFLVELQRKFWGRLIRNNPPEVVVFSDVPHRYFELVLVAMLREASIPIVFLLQPLNRAHTFIDSEYRPFQIEGSVSIVEAIGPKIREVEKKQSWHYDERRMKKGFFAILIQMTKSLGNIVVRGWREYDQSFVHSGLRTRHVKKNLVAAVMWREIFFAVRLLTLKIYYHLISERNIPDRYVYFPLTTQFENTQHPSISPLTLENAFELAYSKLEEGQKLLVREHPMQFKFRHNQKLARSLLFYKRMRRHKNVVFAPLKTNPFDLMQGADSSFCLALGSTIIESLVCGTRVEFVGRLPYWNQTQMHGEVSDLDELDARGFFPGSLLEMEEQEITEAAIRLELLLASLGREGKLASEVRSEANSISE